MSNPLYPGPQMPNGIMQRFQQFQRMFRGDPQQQVQQLLNSGKVSQDTTKLFRWQISSPGCLE